MAVSAFLKPTHEYVIVEQPPGLVIVADGPDDFPAATGKAAAIDKVATMIRPVINRLIPHS